MALSAKDNFRIFLHLSDSAEIVEIADPIRKSVQDKYWVCLYVVFLLILPSKLAL